MMVTEEMPVVTEASMRIHLGKWRIESWGCAVHLLLKHKVINMKKVVWNKILKIVIAVASAILGALGAKIGRAHVWNSSHRIASRMPSSA